MFGVPPDGIDTVPPSTRTDTFPFGLDMMEPTNGIAERTKPFRLVKYFTFSSLFVLFAGALVLSLLNIHWARRMQLDKNRDYAQLLIQNLNHQIFLQFVLPTIIKQGKIQLRDKEQYELMDQVVRTPSMDSRSISSTSTT